MPPTHGSADDIEQRVRVVLHQRAEAIQPQPPAWAELMSRPEGTVVVPLEVGEERRTRRAHGAWLRPALAAASVALIVLTAAVVMENTGGESSEQANSPDATSEPLEAMLGEDMLTEHLVVDGLRLPAPGNGDYQPWMSPPLYPAVDLTASVSVEEDPNAGATAEDGRPFGESLPWLSAGNWRDLDDPYLLDDPGLLAESYIYEDASVTDQLDEGLEVQIDGPQLAELDSRTVPWSMNDVGENAVENKPIEGIVFLRPFPVNDAEAPERWAVVGVRTVGLQLQNVRRDGDTLLFAVNRQSDDSGFSDVRVQVNEEILDEGEIGRNRSEEFQYPLMDSEAATIRIQHMLNGQPISITEMIVPPTGLALEMGAYDLTTIETRTAEVEDSVQGSGGG